MHSSSNIQFLLVVFIVFGTIVVFVDRKFSFVNWPNCVSLFSFGFFYYSSFFFFNFFFSKDQAFFFVVIVIETIFVFVVVLLHFFFLLLFFIFVYFYQTIQLSGCISPWWSCSRCESMQGRPTERKINVYDTSKYGKLNGLV